AVPCLLAGRLGLEPAQDLQEGKGEEGEKGLGSGDVAYQIHPGFLRQWAAGRGRQARLVPPQALGDGVVVGDGQPTPQGVESFEGRGTIDANLAETTHPFAVITTVQALRKIL